MTSLSAARRTYVVPLAEEQLVPLPVEPTAAYGRTAILRRGIFRYPEGSCNQKRTTYATEQGRILA